MNVSSPMTNHNYFIFIMTCTNKDCIFLGIIWQKAVAGADTISIN